MASFSTGPVQLIGEGSITPESDEIGAGLGFGLPAGPFGGIQIATRSNDTFGGSSLELSGGAGYQFDVGPANRFHLCPMAAVGLGIGPNHAFGSGVQRSSRTALLGITVGSTVLTRPNWVMIPSLGLSYAYRKDQADSQDGASLFAITDHYALAQLGLGFVVNTSFSIRPHLDVPIAPDQGGPTVGLTLGYNFGKRLRTRAPRVP